MSMEGHDSGPNHITLEVQGHRFSALVQGPEQGELVLFLHGFPQFADSWLPLIDDVSRAGFRAMAVDQRGYSREARPENVSDYSAEHLLQDVRAFADSQGRRQFHLVAHDWGALVAWEFAVRYPDRLLSLSIVSVGHPDAFADAIESDEDQKQRSRYITLFKSSAGVAEDLLQADDYKRLRGIYQGKVPESAVQANIRRFAEPGALTAALNWYRALDLQRRIGKVAVPVLFIWGSDDLAFRETAATNTALYAGSSYRFVRLEGGSHWLLEELPDQISSLILGHIRAYSQVIWGRTG